MQGPLHVPDVATHAPAAHPSQRPQGLEGTDSEPGDQVATGPSPGRGGRGGVIGRATVEGSCGLGESIPWIPAS